MEESSFTSPLQKYFLFHNIHFSGKQHQWKIWMFQPFGCLNVFLIITLVQIPAGSLLQAFLYCSIPSLPLLQQIWNSESIKQSTCLHFHNLFEQHIAALSPLFNLQQQLGLERSLKRASLHLSWKYIPLYGTLNKGYRFKTPEQGQPTLPQPTPNQPTLSTLTRAHKAFCGAPEGRCFWRGVRLPLQGTGSFTQERRDPGEQVAHPYCFTCRTAEHQPWRHCWFVHEAQQADKKVAPPCATELKFERSEAVSSGGMRSSHGGAEGVPAEPPAQEMDWHLQHNCCALARRSLQRPGVANMTCPPASAAQTPHPLAQTGNAMGQSLKGEHGERCQGCQRLSHQHMLDWMHRHIRTMEAPGLSQGGPTPAWFLWCGFTPVDPPELQCVWGRWWFLRWKSYLQRVPAGSILLCCIEHDKVWWGVTAPSSFQGKVLRNTRLKAPPFYAPSHSSLSLMAICLAIHPRQASFHVI